MASGRGQNRGRRHERAQRARAPDRCPLDPCRRSVLLRRDKRDERHAGRSSMPGTPCHQLVERRDDWRCRRCRIRGCSISDTSSQGARGRATMMRSTRSSRHSPGTSASVPMVSNPGSGSSSTMPIGMIIAVAPQPLDHMVSDLTRTDDQDSLLGRTLAREAIIAAAVRKAGTVARPAVSAAPLRRTTTRAEGATRKPRKRRSGQHRQRNRPRHGREHGQAGRNETKPVAPVHPVHTEGAISIGATRSWTPTAIRLRITEREQDRDTYPDREKDADRVACNRQCDVGGTAAADTRPAHRRRGAATSLSTVGGDTFVTSARGTDNAAVRVAHLWVRPGVDVERRHRLGGYGAQVNGARTFSDIRMIPR